VGGGKKEKEKEKGGGNVTEKIQDYEWRGSKKRKQTNYAEFYRVEGEVGEEEEEEEEGGVGGSKELETKIEEDEVGGSDHRDNRDNHDDEFERLVDENVNTTNNPVEQPAQKKRRVDSELEKVLKNQMDGE